MQSIFPQSTVNEFSSLVEVNEVSTDCEDEKEQALFLVDSFQTNSNVDRLGRTCHDHMSP